MNNANVICPETKVIRISENTITIAATSGILDLNDITLQPIGIYRWLNRADMWGEDPLLRTPYLIRRAIERAPRTRQCVVRKKVSYHTAFPEIEEKFVVSNSTGTGLEIIDGYSTPTLTQWNTRVANNESFNISDSEINNTYAPIIYICTTKSTKCR